jgi:flagellar biosynthesis/type III secretory pathway ATPase
MELIARYRQSEDLILLGAYKQGMNGALDRAVQLQDAITDYLRQDIDQPSPLASSVQGLVTLAKQAA